MGRAGRELAVERFSAAARMGEYLDLYRSQSEDGPPSPAGFST